MQKHTGQEETTTSDVGPGDTATDSAVNAAPSSAATTHKLEPAVPALAVGTRVGEYLIERILSEESNGTTYLAHLTGAESSHPFHLVARPRGAHAALEPILALDLRHPRMLVPREIVSAGEVDYLVIEALPTDDALTARSVGHGARLDLVEALRAGNGLAYALSFLHRNGVAHLHVSPETVVLYGGRAFLTGVEGATLAGESFAEAQRLFARDANFLARTVGVLADVPPFAGADEPPMLRELRELTERGERGGFTSAEEVGAACGHALRSALHLLALGAKEVGTSRLHLRAAAASTVGRVRSENQDASTVALFDVRDDLPGDLPVGLFLVADGMGGEAHGEVASRIAARVVLAEFARAFVLPALALPATLEPGEIYGMPPAPGEGGLATALGQAAFAANQQVFAFAQQLGQSAGSTLTVLATCGAHAAVAHVGDSRAYLLRDGKLIVLTEDHSLLARMQAVDHPLLSDPSFAMPRSVLYRSLGQEEGQPADVLTLSIAEGDRVLLCSDGLWDEIEDERIQQTLAEAEAPQECAEALVHMANAAGGNDNSTAVVLFVSALAHDVDDPVTPPQRAVEESDGD